MLDVIVWGVAWWREPSPAHDNAQRPSSTVVVLHRAGQEGGACGGVCLKWLLMVGKDETFGEVRDMGDVHSS